MRKLLTILMFVMAIGIANASENTGRVKIGVGLLYENGLDITVGYETEGANHNMWEFFANGYLKWAECESCGHVCPESFWKNYRTWCVGAAYKPCVRRGRNNYGNLRMGGSLGADTHEIVGGVHLGYEHSYVLRSGFQLFWGVKTDLIINGRDLFRTGAVLGIKF